MRQAKSVDPFPPIVNALAMTSLLTSHQYEKLIEEASAELKSNPNDGALHWLLGQAYPQMEDIPKMLDERRNRPGFTEKIRRKRRRSLQRCARTMPSGARACCAVGPHRQSRGVALTAPSPDLEII